MSWVMSKTAMPRSRTRRLASAMICACAATSRAVVGSSAMMRSGSAQSASAITTRWRMPPREFVRVSVDALVRGRDADLGQKLDCPLSGRGPRQVRMGPDGLDDLVADAVKRIEAGQRVLNDEADAPAADAAQVFRREIVDAPLREKNFAAPDPAWRVDEADDGRSHHRLPRPGRTRRRPQHLAPRNVERHAVHRGQHAA